MMTIYTAKRSVLLLALIGLTVAFQDVRAQLTEPEVRSIEKPLTPLSEGYSNAWSAGFTLNNFGFGLKGGLGKVLGPYSILTFQTGISGIRDVSEQSFQDYFTGQQIIPNKYKRALGFPFLLGVERRLFPRKIADNFRFFVSGSAGPAMAFVYPYFQDIDNNGLRTTILRNGYQVPVERINDFFSGWKKGESEWGWTGELKLGIHLGENFGRQTTVEFGYFFYYFKQGLQLMEPRKVASYDSKGFINQTEPFLGKQSYFGTPQISISFGGMW